MCVCCLCVCVCGWVCHHQAAHQLLQFSFPKREKPAFVPRGKPQHRTNKPKYTDEEFLRARFQFVVDSSDAGPYGSDPDVRRQPLPLRNFLGSCW